MKANRAELLKIKRLKEIETCVNNPENESILNRLTIFRKYIKPEYLKWINFRFVINWNKFLQPYIIETPKKVYSNYRMEEFYVEGRNGASFFYVFYVPKSYCSEFENKIIAKRGINFYKIYEFNGPKISTEFLFEKGSPDHYILEEILVQKYLYREHMTSLTEDRDLRNILTKVGPEEKFIDIILNRNKFWFYFISLFENKIFKSSRQFDNLMKFIKNSMKYLKENMILLDKLANIIAELPNLDYSLVKIQSHDIDYLNAIINIHFPYSRVFFSPDSKTLFIELALLGKYYTTIDALEESDKFQHYIILNKRKFNSLIKIIDHENNRFKELEFFRK
ncbi:MAG: hypothetical protein ACTSRP_05940 [Candidatus Helarchaeota archaeon]